MDTPERSSIMPGYSFHLDHVCKVYELLSSQTRAKMPKDALRQMIIGSIVPDLLSTAEKSKTHYYVDHPVYGSDYQIPDMKIVFDRFFKKDPTYLGVLCHLQYDKDHVEEFLLKYAKPIGNDKYQNTKTGEVIDALNLFGDWNNVYGELYKLYDKFNSEMAVELTPRLNEFFGTNYSANKDGFLEFIKFIIPSEKMPLSGIPEMDDYRSKDDIHAILRSFFSNDGADCKLNAPISDINKIIEESALRIAVRIDELYAA